VIPLFIVRVRFRFRLLVDEEVLHGEELVQGLEFEAEGFPFGADLFDGHAVFDLDVFGRVAFEAVFVERDLAAGLECFVHLLEHGDGFLELVVGVDEDDPVDFAGGKFGVAGDAENGFDVVDAFFLAFLAEDFVHLGLDVDGEDFAFGDLLGDAAGEKAGAGADVGDDGVFGKVHGCNDFTGLFFLDAVGAFEPGGAEVGHDLGGRAAGGEFFRGIGFGFVGLGVGWEGQGEAERKEGWEEDVKRASARRPYTMVGFGALRFKTWRTKRCIGIGIHFGAFLFEGAIDWGPLR